MSALNYGLIIGVYIVIGYAISVLFALTHPELIEEGPEWRITVTIWAIALLWPFIPLLLAYRAIRRLLPFFRKRPF